MEERVAMAENIDLCLQQFLHVGRTGKPGLTESSVLAGFTVQSKDQHHCICLATGTKCLPASGRARQGLQLNDSHAEVLAKRALQLWIALQLGEASCNAGNRFFTKIGNGRFARSPSWQLHFCCSQSPCGDACIYDASGVRMETGAKVLGPAGLLPCQADVEPRAAQALGAVRRKPGKGEPTLSMSCSDKLAKWALVGCQGALLSAHLAEPLCLDSITIACPPGVRDAAGRAACLEALHRAVQRRTASLRRRLGSAALPLPALSVVSLPESARNLQLSPADCHTPAPCSINWVAGHQAEVTLGSTGQKAGITRKVAEAKPEAAASRLCKAAMLARCMALKSLSPNYLDTFEAAGGSDSWSLLSIAGQEAVAGAWPLCSGSSAERQTAASASDGSTVGIDNLMGGTTQVAGKELLRDRIEPVWRPEPLPTYAALKAQSPQRKVWEVLTDTPSLLDNWIGKPVDLEDFPSHAASLDGIQGPPARTKCPTQAHAEL